MEDDSEEWVLSTRGMGGHWFNEFIEIVKFIIPPHARSIADIPLDIPYIARINIKSLTGELFPTVAKSSMFPHNWSKERIMEEVTWVNENTVAKGKGLNPDSVTKKNKQYKFKDSNGNFDILIEVDNNGRIINAYPLI